MLFTLSILLMIFIAILHFYILIVEMFLWDKPHGMKVFGHQLERAKLTKVMAQNQGLYNGFLASGLVWSCVEFFHEHFIMAIKSATFFLICIAVAGLYGGYTVSKKIIVVQTIPAILALILLYTAILYGLLSNQNIPFSFQ